MPVILAVPEAEAAAVNIAVHVEVPRVVVAARVHGEPVMLPVAVPDAEKLTVPAGLILVPAVELSVTIAVQVED